MVIGLLLVQLVLCASILHREIMVFRFRNLATSLFYLVYFIVYVAEPLMLHLLFDGPTSIMAGSPTVFSDPYVYYLFNCYGITLLLTSILIRRPEPAPSPLAAVPEAIPGSVLVTGEPRVPNEDFTAHLSALIVAGTAIFIYSTGMSIPDLLVASRFSWFDAASFSILWHTVSSYFLALAGIYAYQITVSKERNLWLLAAGFAAIVLYGIITKDRKWIVLLPSGWLAARYDLSGRLLIIRKRVVIWAIVLFWILLVSGFARDAVFRYALGEPIDLVDEFVKNQVPILVSGDISYFYRASLEAIHQNVNHAFLVPLGMARRILFFFLPVGWSGGLKVEDLSATFSDVVDGGDALRRGNMPPGLFGLFVISFGWFASLFLIPSIAFLLRKLDSFFRTGRGLFRQVTIAMFAFAVLFAFRGDDSSAEYFIVSSFIFVGAAQLWRILRRPGSGLLHALFSQPGPVP